MGASSGQIVVAQGAVLDHEAVSSYTVTVSYSDGKDEKGNADPSADGSVAVTINVTDVDEPPAKPAAPTVTGDDEWPNTRLSVEWTAPSTTGPSLSGYALRYRVQGASEWSRASPWRAWPPRRR